MVVFLLIVQIIVAIAMISFILLQQSEGGASGFVSGQMTGIASSRGTANFLTRATTILAICFVGLSLTLAYLSKRNMHHSDILDDLTQQEKKQSQNTSPTAPTTDQAPQTPVSQEKISDENSKDGNNKVVTENTPVTQTPPLKNDPLPSSSLPPEKQNTLEKKDDSVSDNTSSTETKDLSKNNSS